MKKSELKRLIKEILSEDISLQNKKFTEDKAKRLEQELDLEYKVKFGVEVYIGNITLTKQTLPYFKKYSKIKKLIGDLLCNVLDLESLTELSIPEEVEGNFSCYQNKLTSLEGAPKYIGGDFICTYNKLTSLKGAPEKVGERFMCFNNNLTTLEGAPKIVRKTFSCSNNKLTSLKGAPRYVGLNFWCDNNKLTSLEGAPEYVGDGFYCTDNPTKFTQEDVRKVCDVKGNISC